MERTKVTVQLPFISFSSLGKIVETIREKTKTFFSTAYQAMTTVSESATHSISARKARKFLKSPFLPLGIVVLLVLLFFIFSVRAVLNRSNSASSSDPRVSVERAKATAQLNKTLSFPLKDDTGKQVSTFTFALQSAELRDQIIVKGTPATAIKGRTFLIVNIKIVNDYSKPITINSRDYIRLTLNNSSEKLAPDIHNDPVEVQAISTKYTRVGFPISDTDKNLTLYIGEITGPKQTVKINFK